MWFWKIIKEVLYNIFVEAWVVGLIAFTLLVFFGLFLFTSLFSSIMEEGLKFIDLLVILLLILAVVLIAVAVYIVYWYFTNHHFILGSVAILISLAVIYITCIEPHIQS